MLPRTRRTLLALAAIGAFIVVAPSQVGNSAPYGQVTAMGLGASPNNWNGACPVTITFNGWIRTDGPNTVTYGIFRSDGARGNGQQTLHFTRAESLNVHFTWRLGSPGENYRGWAQIGSGNVRSDKAGFQIHCRR